MRIAVYGGSFDPPHLGHVAAATSAVKALEPDSFLVIPDNLPPHKELSDTGAPPMERLAMCALAFGQLKRCTVSDMELRREGVSYSVDTLAQLCRDYPGAELSFLIGADMLSSFEQWRDFRGIINMAELVVFSRETDGNAAVERDAQRLRELYGASVRVLSHEPLPVSSTEVRELLCRGEGRSLLPESVYAHIVRRRLYEAEPELAWLREASAPLYKPRRIPHVRGCEAEAVALAGRYGVGTRPAAVAAILHDITKKLSHEEQLILCDRYGILNDNAELCALKLLHAKTGAAMARELFGVSDEVASAIRWHTTGRPDMTTLEKVIYLADYIEPTRSFDGVERLRELAYVDLDEAVELGLLMSLEEVRGRGETPHPDTLTAYEYIKQRKTTT